MFVVLGKMFVLIGVFVETFSDPFLLYSPLSFCVRIKVFVVLYPLYCIHSIWNLF